MNADHTNTGERNAEARSAQDDSDVNVGRGEIVHEWLEPVGGAENVIEELLHVLPEAKLTAAWNDAPARFPAARETVLGRTPLRRSKPLALPAMPLVWRHLGSSDAQWVLSSSHLFAHHARFSGPARDAVRLVYAYTPARYIWSPELDQRGRSRAVKSLAPAFRHLDKRRAAEADSIVAISRHVARRIEEFWDQPSDVIYPPVDARAIITELATETDLTVEEQVVLAGLPRDFVLGASRFVPYKRLEDVISAGEAADLPVVLAGDGPHRPVLEDRAASSSVPVTFVKSPSTPLLRRVFERATVYVFPALEDFGIVPVEAMAAGTGVVALDTGGSSETVISGRTGATVPSFASDDLSEAVRTAAGVDPEACRARSLDFDTEIFRRNIRGWVTRSVR